ncbi:MAG: hypothetical protein AAF337_15015, partial [Pseudomonadota bacterium]
AQRLSATLAAMDGIDQELSGLAAAAMAAPEHAQASPAFVQSLHDAEQALAAWTRKTENVATALALAKDAL